MAHRNARLTEFGRLLLVQQITELGWPPAQAAESLGVSRATAYKWLGRYRQHGQAGPADRSSRPTVARMRSRPARCVECWPPAGAAARAPIGSATTWPCPARPSMGCCAATT
jgi:transposase-like protein